jgi:hypothetical protein
MTWWCRFELPMLVMVVLIQLDPELAPALFLGYVLAAVRYYRGGP